MHDFPFKTQQHLWLGSCAFKRWVLQLFKLLSINQNYVHSLLELVNYCRLKVLVAWLKGLAVTGPGGVHINDEEFTVLIVEVCAEVFEVLDDGC